MNQRSKSAPNSPDPDALALVHRGKRRFWGGAVVVGLVVGLLPALLGVLGTLLVAQGVFSDLPEGVPRDPETLAVEISAALVKTMWALGVSMLGVCFLYVAMIRLSSLTRCGASDGAGLPVEEPAGRVF